MLPSPYPPLNAYATYLASPQVCTTFVRNDAVYNFAPTASQFTTVQHSSPRTISSEGSALKRPRHQESQSPQVQQLLQQEQPFRQQPLQQQPHFTVGAAPQMAADGGAICLRCSKGWHRSHEPWCSLGKRTALTPRLTTTAAAPAPAAPVAATPLAASVATATAAPAVATAAPAVAAVTPPAAVAPAAVAPASTTTAVAATATTVAQMATGGDASLICLRCTKGWHRSHEPWCSLGKRTALTQRLTTTAAAALAAAPPLTTAPLAATAAIATVTAAAATAAAATAPALATAVTAAITATAAAATAAAATAATAIAFDASRPFVTTSTSSTWAGSCPTSSRPRCASRVHCRRVRACSPRRPLSPLHPAGAPRVVAGARARVQGL